MCFCRRQLRSEEVPMVHLNKVQSAVRLNQEQIGNWQRFKCEGFLFDNFFPLIKKSFALLDQLFKNNTFVAFILVLTTTTRRYYSSLFLFPHHLKDINFNCYCVEANATWDERARCIERDMCERTRDFTSSSCWSVSIAVTKEPLLLALSHFRNFLQLVISRPLEALFGFLRLDLCVVTKMQFIHVLFVIIGSRVITHARCVALRASDSF